MSASCRVLPCPGSCSYRVPPCRSCLRCSSRPWPCDEENVSTMLSHVEEKVETFGPTPVWLQLQAHQSARPLMLLANYMWFKSQPIFPPCMVGWMVKLKLESWSKEGLLKGGVAETSAALRESLRGRCTRARVSAAPHSGETQGLALVTGKWCKSRVELGLMKLIVKLVELWRALLRVELLSVELVSEARIRWVEGWQLVLLRKTNGDQTWWSWWLLINTQLIFNQNWVSSN